MDDVIQSQRLRSQISGCIDLPLMGLNLLVWGTIVESIPSIRVDHRALQQRSAEDA